MVVNILRKKCALDELQALVLNLDFSESIAIGETLTAKDVQYNLKSNKQTKKENNNYGEK